MSNTAARPGPGAPGSSAPGPSAPGPSAIVSGGAGGLGSAVVHSLVAQGWGVVALDRDAAGLDELAAVAARDGRSGAVAVIRGDAAEPSDIDASIAAARRFGRLGLLVNAAGGAVSGGTTLRTDGSPHSLESFELSLRVNTVATFNAIRLVAGAMAGNEPNDEGQRGVIINTASVSGYEGQRGQVAYAAAKAAILGMTLPLARDLASVGVRVCAIAPGPMATPGMLSVLDSLDSDPTVGIVFPERMGRPEEFARLVLDIAGNPYLNGENIRLDAALRLSAGHT